ncbi:MAG: ADP-ribosylglycohydrolase family protein [Desulfosarcina sp.]|nr:ADP-ribosylglycohydrolase family protein [Desulfosarcina sp.]MBC2767561.1 ADP-ribosylglycohydrolase family protein [Desulfosarcina sp.]
MIGAIAGDMIGSPYENRPIKTVAFPMTVAGCTDDTILTVAVAHAIVTGTDYRVSIKSFAQEFPNLPYGGSFRYWIWDPKSKPYNSYGNGSAMRVSAVGFAFESIEEVMVQARRSAEVSHNHPEGIKGAQATALAVLLARKGEDKTTIREQIEARFAYDLGRTVDDIRPGYSFDVTCQGSVPESIIAFLDAEDYETTVKNAISLGGDADTMACIAGGIAQAFYKAIPVDIVLQVRNKLPQVLLEVLDQFNDKFNCEF